MMNKFSPLVLTLLLFSQALFAQIGIGTTAPEASLDVQSVANGGMLIPRVALTSTTDNTTVVNTDSGALAESTLVYNDGTGGLTPAGFYYWQNSQWNQILSETTKQIHFGKILVTSAGTEAVTGVGFTPSAVEFVAMNRIQDFNTIYRSDGNNTNDIRMAGGTTFGYAQNNGGTIDQQVISNAFSGSSINNIGTFASDTHCIAAYFVNNNGQAIHDNGTASGGSEDQDGLIRATLQSFDSDGFTLNFDRFLSPTTASPDRTNQIVILYKAYK